MRSTVLLWEPWLSYGSQGCHAIHGFIVGAMILLWFGECSVAMSSWDIDMSVYMVFARNIRHGSRCSVMLKIGGAFGRCS